MSSEHLKYDIMPYILLISPGKSPQFTNHFSSIHPEGNTQLQIRKLWLPLRSALYISFFLSYLCKYLSIVGTRCPTEKNSKRQFNYSKQQRFIFWQHQYKMLNKKIVSKVYNVLYNDSTGGKTMSKYQHTEESTRKVRALLY